MSSTTTTFSVRLDSDIKRQSESVLNELGMSLTGAINAFLRQVVRVGGMPFDMRLSEPQRETILAMLEAEKLSTDPSATLYTDVDEALRELKS